MIEITQKENSLVIENYQNRLNNLSWLDVVDNLEVQGLFIRIDNVKNIPVARYKGKKYIVKDSDIEQLENSNVVVFISC